MSTHWVSTSGPMSKIAQVKNIGTILGDLHVQKTAQVQDNRYTSRCAWSWAGCTLVLHAAEDGFLEDALPPLLATVPPLRQLLKRRDAAAEAAKSSGCIWLHLQMQEWNRIVVVELVVLKLVVVILQDI